MILIEISNEDSKKVYKDKMYKYVVKTTDDVQEIVENISPEERKLLGGIPGTDYMKDDEIKDVAKRFIKKAGSEPVAFLDIYYGSKNAGSISIVTKHGKKYRNKGYATNLINQAKQWLNSVEAKIIEIKYLDYYAKRDNQISIKLAQKNGFIEKDDYKDDKEWWGGRYPS